MPPARIIVFMDYKFSGGGNRAATCLIKTDKIPTENN